MLKLDTPKKPAPQDWHRADIKAALEKRGFSLSKLSRLNGFARTACALALHQPWPKMERLIAGALNKQPREIWPTRYNEDGTPKKGRGEGGPGRLELKAKHITVERRRFERRRTVQRGRAI